MPPGEATNTALDWLDAFVRRRAVTEAQADFLRLVVEEGRAQANAHPRGLTVVEIPVLTYAAAGGARPLEHQLPLLGCCLCVYLGADVVDNVVDRELPERWLRHGPAQAMLAGGAFLAALAPVAIGELDTPDDVRLALRDALALALLAMLAGQSDDIAFEGRDDVTLSASEAMLMGKSGAELAFLSRAGALLAGAPPDVCNAYATFGLHWGTMIQILSDCADLASDGEESRDLATGKRTLPILYTLATLSDPVRTEFLAHLRAAPADAARAREARRMLGESGAFHYGALAAESHRQCARAALAVANPVGPAGKTLLALTTHPTTTPWGKSTGSR